MQKSVLIEEEGCHNRSRCRGRGTLPGQVAAICNEEEGLQSFRLKVLWMQTDHDARKPPKKEVERANSF